MVFRDYAANETSALVARLFTNSSKTSLQQLQSFRQALETATRAIETALGTTPKLDDEILKLVERLSKAAAAETQASTARAYEEARATIEETRTELKAQASELKVQTGEKEKLAASLKEMHAQADALRAELQKQKEQAAAAAAELAAARDAHKKIEAAYLQTEKTLQKEVPAKAALEGELKETRNLLDQARAESARISKELEAAVVERTALTAAVRTAQGELQAVKSQHQTISALSKASAARVQTLERAHSEADGRFGALFEELLGGFQSLSKAATIAEVLSAFVNGLAAEFSRVAVFRLKGNRLQGEHQVGFDPSRDIAKVAMPLAVDSLLTRAAISGQIETPTSSESADRSRAPFGGTPSCALALPVVVHGETLAIVYADDSSQTEKKAAAIAPELRAMFAALLLRHASALLMRLTTELKALAELRDYSTMLLGELEHMYLADASAGKKGDDLQKRLKDNLECARRVYSQRVAMEGPAAAELLSEQLSVVVEARSDTRFGRDLAHISGHASPTREGARSQLAAEAS